jgi:catechol 2,3-dioxygenase-like lactoylglutathione lyase family enzyme
MIEPTKSTLTDQAVLFMSPSRLNHVALTVSDRAESARFYRAYFGFGAAVHEDDHLLILSDESGGLLALSEGDVPLQPPRTTHFGVQLETGEAVRALRGRFAADGVAQAEWQEAGPVRVQVFDPDGYRVEAYAFD